MSVGAPEGTIRARLHLKSGVIDKIDIEPRPAPPVKALLQGREVAEAVKLLPRLFSICGTAQTVAALGAVEAALGITAGPAQLAARQLFLLAETVQEHTTRWLIDAPLLFGLAPDAANAKAIRRHIAGLGELVSPAGAWVRPGGGNLAPDPQALASWHETLRQLVLDGVLGGRDLAGAATLEDWTKQAACLPARILSTVLEHHQAGLGDAMTPLMGHLDGAYIQSRVRAEPAFISLPVTANGLCLETGPLSRQADHPLIKNFKDASGYGLAARLVARLLELSHAVTGIALSLPLLESAQASEVPCADGEGLGAAEAARGRLFHWVRLENGRVADYRLLAPTEWNFHPEGAYATGLKELAAKTAEEAAHLARLQGLALDPCVALELEVA